MKNINLSQGFFIKAKVGKNIFIYCWDNVSKPRAVVQIFHGMAEHAGRYESFAKYLNKSGYIVYADDHRGHGRTAGSIDELGYVGEDGFNKTVEDEHLITKHIKEKHGKLPIIIFGHSFGSFLAQEYIIRYGKDISATVLCGTAAKAGIDIAMGRVVAYIEKCIFGDKKKSKLLDFLTFQGYNKRIKDSCSKLAWVSSDPQEVKKYEEDPFCGTVFTAGFYYYFLKGLSKLYIKERLAQIPVDLPIFIIAGDQDPVGNYGNAVKELYDIYKKSGMEDIKLKLYMYARHEILNEVNRDEVYSDVVNWLQDKVIE
jgi:alpha-beta hydrolase superfamily lysophospholipase